MSDKTVYEVLTEARAILVKRGWTRGVHSNGGRVCAQAAINLAAGQRLNGYNAFTRKVISRVELAAGTRNLSMWNDEQASRTPVLAAFDLAIKACK